MVEVSVHKPKDKLINVQIMRAAAALMVVTLHAQAFGVHNQNFSTPNFVPFTLIQLGNGVDIFFVISGFIITLASARIVQERNIAEFVRRRIVRIVPLYWAILTAWIALILVKSAILHDPTAAKQITPVNVVGSYLFYPVDGMGYGPKYPFPILDLGWTLNFEMLFYVLFALCMVAGPKWFNIRLAMTLFCLIFIGFTPLASEPPLSFWSQPITLEFLAGVGLALAYRAGWRIGAFGQILLIAVGMIVWMLLRERTFGPIPIGAKGSYSWPRVASCGVGAVLIMAGAVLGVRQWTNWLGRRVADLGDASYALYLTHVLTFTAWRLALEALPLKVDWNWGLTLVMVLSAIVVAEATHLLIEKPLTEWLNRLGRTRTV